MSEMGDTNFTCRKLCKVIDVLNKCRYVLPVCAKPLFDSHLFYATSIWRCVKYKQTSILTLKKALEP